MFQTAQWAQASEAAASLAQMAARGAKGDPALAGTGARAPGPGRRNGRSAIRRAALPCRKRRTSATEQPRQPTWPGLPPSTRALPRSTRRLAADFPDYAALARPEPLSVEEVQAQLRADEALVLFLDTPEWKPTPEETFIWVVTKTDMRWVRSELGTPSLRREVGGAALRARRHALEGRRSPRQVRRSA